MKMEKLLESKISRRFQFRRLDKTTSAISWSISTEIQALPTMIIPMSCL